MDVNEMMAPDEIAVLNIDEDDGTDLTSSTGREGILVDENVEVAADVDVENDATNYAPLRYSTQQQPLLFEEDDEDEDPFENIDENAWIEDHIIDAPEWDVHDLGVRFGGEDHWLESEHNEEHNDEERPLYGSRPVQESAVVEREVEEEEADRLENIDDSDWTFDDRVQFVRGVFRARLRYEHDFAHIDEYDKPVGWFAHQLRMVVRQLTARVAGRERLYRDDAWNNRNRDEDGLLTIARIILNCFESLPDIQPSMNEDKDEDEGEDEGYDDDPFEHIDEDAWFDEWFS